MNRRLPLLAGLLGLLLLSGPTLASEPQPDVAPTTWSSARLLEDAANTSDPGQAALARHRASLIDPVGAADPTVHPLVVPLAPSSWLVGSWALGLLLALLGSAGLVIGHRRQMLGVAALGGLLVSLASVALVERAAVRDLVVVTSTTPLYVSPALSSPTSSALEPGVPMVVTEIRGGFLRVEGEGTRGWVPRSALTHVVPPNT